MFCSGLVHLSFVIIVCADLCIRPPLDSKTAPLPADDRFVISIEGIDEKYIPTNNYTVRVYSRDGRSSFVAFAISIGGDEKPNENKNVRRPIILDAGTLTPHPDFDGVRADVTCNNSVIQADTTPKTEVKAMWLAPPKGNKCVTFYTFVAIKPDVWYNHKGPLSKVVCEDTRKADDMQPPFNDNCRTCEDARYLLTFEGMWSFNTHPLMFPRGGNGAAAHFSDIVGASHSKYFYIYKTNSDASRGLKMLAEQGNTTELELEVQDKLFSEPRTVRTVVKATGQPYPNMTSSATFRASQEHHLLSLVTAIIPSPDWFLGVSNLELCDARTGRWAKYIRLNLYPMDAGTDSGQDFESPNEETSPPHPITTAAIMKRAKNKEDVKPFARLTLELMRTYPSPNCAVTTERPEVNSIDNSDNYGYGNRVTESSYEPDVAHTTSVEPDLDPDSNPDCPVTEWDPWHECEGECIDGHIQDGYKTRFRHYLIGGVIVDYKGTARVPKECEEVRIVEVEPCNDPCSLPTMDDEEASLAENVTPARRVWG